MSLQSDDVDEDDDDDDYDDYDDDDDDDDDNNNNNNNNNNNELQTNMLRTAEIIQPSANVKAQNIFHGRNNITCSTKCKYRTVATPYTLDTWFVSGI